MTLDAAIMSAVSIAQAILDFIVIASGWSQCPGRLAVLIDGLHSPNLERHVLSPDNIILIA
jgi:hypothetical protein